MFTRRFFTDLYATTYSFYAARGTKAERTALPRSICTLVGITVIFNILQVAELLSGARILPAPPDRLTEIGVGLGIFIAGLLLSREFVRRQPELRSQDVILAYSKGVSTNRKHFIMTLVLGNFIVFGILAKLRHMN